MLEVNLPENMNGFKIHFVGIKGTGMVALVEICKARGAFITGSDVEERFYTDDILDKLKIKPLLFSKENISTILPDLVIYSSAYKLDVNPDLIKAQELGIQCVLYTEALGAISKKTYSCGICGVHGKTTTTGLAGTIIKEIDLPCQILAGSVIKSFGDCCTYSAGNKYFIAETCEYQRHFMSFNPKKIVLTSVESDHEDYYPEYKDILSAFVDYICLLPQNGQLIYCADNKGAVEAACIASEKRPDIKLIPYGVNAEGDYKISSEKIISGLHIFTLAAFNGEFELQVPGRHLLLDAVAALALAVELYKEEYKISPNNKVLKSIQGALKSYAGGKRRSEIIGDVGNVLFIDDYGHHPTAVRETLQGYKEFYNDRYIIVDFMAHTYTRTAALLEEFASCFTSADEVILHKIYPSAREVYTGIVSGKTLYARTMAHHKNVKYFEEVLDAEDYVEKRLKQEIDLSSGKKGYLFVTMGAGDNWRLGRNIYKKIKENTL